MNRALDYVSWMIVAFLAAPTILIMVSWQSLPGDPLYGAKLGFEHALLLVTSPSYEARADLSVRYTQRRMTETRVLLATEGSGEGLPYLSQQIQATKEVIRAAPDPVVKKRLVQTYISTLQQVSGELAQEREYLTGNHTTGETTQSSGTVGSYLPPAAGSSPTRVPTDKPMITPTPATQPTIVPSEGDSDDVIGEIDEVQEEIEEAIEELTPIANQAADVPPVPTVTSLPSAAPAGESFQAAQDFSVPAEDPSDETKQDKKEKDTDDESPDSEQKVHKLEPTEVPVTPIPL